MEAFPRKNVRQAPQVNERVHWSLLWTPTRYMLWHPRKASGSSLKMSDHEIRCIDLRGNEEFIHVSPSNVTPNLDICSESQAPKWSL